MISENRNTLATILLAAIIVALFWYFKSTVLLAFLAVLLALIMHMPSSALIRWGVPKTLSYMIGVVFCLVIILLVFVTVIPALITGVSEAVSSYPNALTQLQGYYDSLRKMLTFLPELNKLFANSGENAGSAIMPAITSSLGKVAGMLGQTLVVFVIAIFLLTSPMDYRELLLRLFPKVGYARANELLDMMHHGLKSWLKTLGMSISVTFILVFGSFMLIGFPYAFEVAVITGAATFIPTIGAIIPIVPIVVFGLTAESPWIILIALPIYIIIQQVEGNVITPSFQKAELNILPAGILLFQIVAAQVFGVLGVLMAVPILVVFSTLIREFYCKDLMGWDSTGA